MKFDILHQDSYSRGELIMRALFGWIYIGIPHYFLLYFLSIGSAFVTFIAFWSILFTEKYPKGMFEFQVKLMRWNYRVTARLMNLADGYPPFGLDAEDDVVELEIEYPEKLSRGKLLLKVFFGFIYVLIPHGFILMFRMFATMFLTGLVFWAILFTGNYPESWHRFNVGTMRWGFRVGLYMQYMTDRYPPFTGKKEEELEFSTT